MSSSPRPYERVYNEYVMQGSAKVPMDPEVAASFTPGSVIPDVVAYEFEQYVMATACIFAAAESNGWEPIQLLLETAGARKQPCGHYEHVLQGQAKVSPDKEVSAAADIAERIPDSVDHPYEDYKAALSALLAAAEYEDEDPLEVAVAGHARAEAASMSAMTEAHVVACLARDFEPSENEGRLVLLDFDGHTPHSPN